jgi:hypothetical protein
MGRPKKSLEEIHRNSSKAAQKRAKKAHRKRYKESHIGFVSSSSDSERTHKAHPLTREGGLNQGHDQAGPSIELPASPMEICDISASDICDGAEGDVSASGDDSESLLDEDHGLNSVGK